MIEPGIEKRGGINTNKKTDTPPEPKAMCASKGIGFDPNGDGIASVKIGIDQRDPHGQPYDKCGKFIGTEIYGASDDLVEFVGDYHGEVGCYDIKRGLIVCSDGTILEVKYNDIGHWIFTVLNKGM